MKDIREMTIEEMTAEIRGYEFKKDQGYAFISYSHRDQAQVYPLVLSWLRAGYNIYIDLDFERHGSDSNWADLMLSTLSSRLCRLGVCFKSSSYRYSYASLLELLTMRGETVTNRHSGKSLYVDSVALESIPDDDEIPESIRSVYAEYFQSMQDSMGAQFLGQNRKEANLLLEGLDFWLGETATKSALRTAISAEKMMGYIQDAYLAGYQDFFPQIAYLVKNWFISQDLNGNDYSLQSSLAIRLSRFNEVRVEQVRESLLPDNSLWAPFPSPSNREAAGSPAQAPRQSPPPSGYPVQAGTAFSSAPPPLPRFGSSSSDRGTSAPSAGIPGSRNQTDRDHLSLAEEMMMPRKTQPRPSSPVSGEDEYITASESPEETAVGRPRFTDGYHAHTDKDYFMSLAETMDKDYLSSLPLTMMAARKTQPRPSSPASEEDEYISASENPEETASGRPYLSVESRKTRLGISMTPAIVNLPQGNFTIGRSITCGYRIADNPAVGRTHAVIRTTGSRSVLIDQNSKNGTYLNGSLLTPGMEYELHNGDKIRISSEVFHFCC